MIKEDYLYKAHVVRVYDADTVTVDIDLGLHAGLSGETLRLYGIDAPELRGTERPSGLLARDYLRELVLDKDVTIQTFKDDKGKYGRWLARIWLNGIDVNAHLVERGYAEWY